MMSSGPRTPYKICTRCVMDISAEEIAFDPQGVCSFCHWFENHSRPEWHPDPSGWSYLLERAEQIKAVASGQDFDCMFGISGGIDSSFMALQIKRLGLRPLVVHVDTGWNSELAVHNIEKVVKALGFDLHTVVIDWDEMRDLQVAFFRSGVANQDIPQDNAIFATLHKVARETGIRTLFQGFNIVTESVLPRSWGFDNMDSRHIRAIHQRFGRVPLATYPLLSFRELCNLRYGFPEPRPYETISLLNHVPYVREQALASIIEKLGFRDYGAKHGESFFTKFYQGYFLPRRFGFDKRRPHYSSLILAGQMTREQALEKLKEPAYDLDRLDEDRSYFIKKLGVTDDEFEHFVTCPIRPHQVYASYQPQFEMAGNLASHEKKLRDLWDALEGEANA